MLQLAALSILALTVGLALGRPRLWQVSLDHAPAAVIGALLCVAFGVVSVPAVGEYLLFLAAPVVTIVSLMTVTVVADHAGLFRFLARSIARAARGDARRLFLYIFAIGSATGTMFTNDAAVLIFTPLVYRLVEDVAGDDWTVENKIPFYFAVLYVANVAGALVISNPINIVVSEMIGISFFEYARWMFLPAIVSIVASYAGIRLVFRKAIPERFVPLPPATVDPARRRAMVICALVLGLMLLAFFAGEATGVPVWAVALCAALALLAMHKTINRHSNYRSIVTGISWDVIVFLIGIFVVTRGVMGACITPEMKEALASVAVRDLDTAMHATGFGAAALSSFLNNHPTADMLGLLISQMELTQHTKHMLAFSALIGADLGPKMLPIGSLAALIWFGILRRHGVVVSYWQYIRIGVPVTLAAILLALLTLHVEMMLFDAGLM